MEARKLNTSAATWVFLRLDMYDLRWTRLHARVGNVACAATSALQEPLRYLALAGREGRTTRWRLGFGQTGNRATLLGTLRYSGEAS